MQNISGTYQLINYGYYFKKESKFEPISDCYSGTIHYSDTGFMSVILRFKEKPTAFEDIVGYCGTYEVKEDKIYHTVTNSVRPEYEKQLLTRKFKLDGGVRLEIEFENTSEFRKFSVWQKKV